MCNPHFPVNFRAGQRKALPFQVVPTVEVCGGAVGQLSRHELPRSSSLYY